MIGLRTAPVKGASALALPVLMKEMRTRMRGLRAPLLLFITTALTIVVAMLIIAPQWAYLEGSSAAEMARALARVGNTLFIGMVILEAILCAVIAPALTAGAISIEREQETFDLLLLTRLTSTNIVLGKLLSSLSFAAIILLCSLPVAAISFLLGGVSPGDLAWALLLIGGVVALFGSMGLWCSARFQKTATAVAVAYGICIAWLALLPAGVTMIISMYSYSGHTSKMLRGDGSFLVLAGLLCAIVALMASTTLCVFLSLLIRRSLSRVLYVILWALFTAALLALVLIDPRAIIDKIYGAPFWGFIGNPAVAIGTLVIPDDLSGFYRSSTWAEYWFLPLTIIIHAIGAWVFCAMTVGELRKMRS